MRRALLVAAVAVLFPVGDALAQQSPDVELAERHAPVLRLKAQNEQCGRGEPYAPIDVEVLFDNPEVAFRGPWDRVNLVRVGPNEDDLAQGYYDYHLDFPGDALNPGCTYEEWNDHLTQESEPTAYARVVTESAYPGRLALQYWFFYIYNDFNNKHEGDWEMIQLEFAASTSEEALTRDPVAVGYSQHEGAERAAWGDEKLEVVGQTHPVVYPAAGSHANYFTSDLFLGRSAAQGVGCDDTTGPSLAVRPTVAVVPSGDDLSAFPWLAYEGRWGELRPSFYNGPTGPNLKRQWTQPIGWAEESWRDQSFPVPGGAELLPAATTFFCQAVGTGSSLLTRATRNPTGGLLLVLALAWLGVWSATRTTWRPGTPLRLRRRRTVGQLLNASGQMYRRNLRLFAGIGLIFVPIALLVASIQAVLFLFTPLEGLTDVAGASNPVVASALFGLSLVFNLVGLGIVQATVARAMATIDAGREVSALSAYREVLARLRELGTAALLIVLVVAPLTLSFFLIPFAVWLLVRWSLTGQAVELGDRDARSALGHSHRLVRGSWLRTGTVVVGVGALATAAGPLIGALALLGTDAAFWVANVIAGIIYVFAFPYAAVVTTYMYYDLEVREAMKPGDAHLPAQAPAEERRA